MLLALLPMALALLVLPEGERSVGVEFGSMLGLLALGVLAMQLVISGRHRWFGSGVGLDNMLQVHRQLGIFALVLVLVHPAVMMFSNPDYVEYLDPRQETLRAMALILIVLATSVLIVSSLWRKRLGLSYEWWRALHGALALFVVAGGLGHALMVSHFTAGVAIQLLLILLFAIPLGLLLDSRLLRVMRMRRRPWRVVVNHAERGDAVSLTFEPQGDHRLDFKAGQYLWITLGKTPFSLQQHPFSISTSAAQPGRIGITAKCLGDFTCSLPDVVPGSLAWVEGPYGDFVSDPHNPSGIVLMAGGIGVTPMMSMLRTYRDGSVKMPLWLVYANETWEEATYREELDELTKALDLEVIHVIDQPPEGWEGESGFIDEALITRRLPADDGRREYFICGPAPMMNATEKALRSVGVSPTRINSDHFDLV
ncbi:ferredoxin reductase family protein [Halomonas sp. PA5]|nr:ferredoxin reductase family protein [Halomonas populi]QJQ96978.1 ferredoxin reductase family protein [Halomonas sp. PA5]